MTATTFTELELDESLIDALTGKGYQRPTVIQAATIPAAMEGRDVLGSAPTGTGKTAAFLLPTIQHLLDFPRKKSGPPRVLILTPTRELAMQVAEQARELSAYTHLDIATITGGVAYMNHAEVFSENQDIVVATTGRLLQYIKEENFDCRAVEILILDEADRMLDMGFANDIETIAGETRWRKQTMLFSATLEGNAVRDFAERILENPLEIDADPSRRERKKIQQFYYRADNIEHKTALLCHLLKQEDVTKSIVFVRKRERVREVVQWLRSAGIEPSYLEGEMVQAKRTDAIKRLDSGQVKVLVATDIASRGLDIENISHVFNFDLPRTADVYLHRIGRTARAGRKGIAISLVEAHDYPLFGKVTRYIEEQIKVRVVDELRPSTKAPSDKMLNNPKPSKKVLEKRKEKKKQEESKKKVKIRHRDSKNIGKRRTPANTENTATDNPKPSVKSSTKSSSKPSTEKKRAK
ncbi:ATP-dependent RNA helicase SrmB [Moellerella wisconsensis]|uniref:ATP-dependent RNA helicase SrmB n=1 Tax=Moellerella wisconsensis TaxID=158849 RepID=A0A9Q8PYY1_9GAMM|nr:ATP-dependent RNA helicase SrmB [Moellerella wisconsensis]KLN95821.1 ATP-dependent RNA helicase SrmB [Moellerella wisconsensis]UNH26384.1 ATP-dependent RNA helicase SrmB [Moellerella wisconsensis]UNH29799.1 ATP-dependent RNA helicase SrmB [Moellerella wisconsensis]